MLFIDHSAKVPEFAADLLVRLAARAQASERLLFVDDIGSEARVDYRARTIDRAVTKDWFIFPWEAVFGQVIEDVLAEPDCLR